MSGDRTHPAEDLLIYLRLLTGEARLGQFLDIRWAVPSGGMSRRFVSALRIDEAAGLIARFAAHTDVFVGVALRDGDSDGGNSAISGSHLLWVECDHERAEPSVARLAFPPTIEIASGTPGHLHIYWRLHERAANVHVESANRRLALALGGDLASVDIARILRPALSLNYKRDPPQPVRLLAYRQATSYGLEEITRRLPKDPACEDGDSARVNPRAAGRTLLDRQLLAIPAAEYVRVLADRSPNAAGKVLCPFHEERNPSLQLYPDGTFYCFGSGCRRGGTIYDFAAELWGLTPRDRQFLALRDRLATCFGLDEASPS